MKWDSTVGWEGEGVVVGEGEGVVGDGVKKLQNTYFRSNETVYYYVLKTWFKTVESVPDKFFKFDQ